MLPWKLLFQANIKFNDFSAKSFNLILVWNNGILPGKVIENQWNSLQNINLKKLDMFSKKLDIFSYMVIMCLLTMTFKWVPVATRKLTNILHSFLMCFIRKLIILIKHMYDVAPQKLGKSRCILAPFSRIIPAVAALKGLWKVMEKSLDFICRFLYEPWSMLLKGGPGEYYRTSLTVTQ